MRRTIIVLIILTGLVAIPAMAQDADFTSAKPQFFSFSLGVPIAYDIDQEEFVSGAHFGFSLAIADNLEVGYDRLINSNFLRVAYSFTDMIGAGIGFGTDGTESRVSLGITGTFFQARSSNGLAYSLGLRIDYDAPTDDFEKGLLIFTVRSTFGL